MPTKYYEIGNELNRVPYTGDDSTAVYYSGTHKTVGRATIASGDTVEIPLCELPAGARLEAINFQIDAPVAASAWTVAFVLRKKSNSIYQGSTIGGGPTSTGIASGAPDITLAAGALTGGASPVGTGAGVGAMVGAAAIVVAPIVVGTAPTGTANVTASLFPAAIEGTTLVNGAFAARNTLQEAYYLGILLTASGIVALSAGINIQIGVDAEFIGTL